MILVPMDAPGVTIRRMLPVFGYDDAPHGHAEIDVRERARAGGEHAARRRPRLRDRAGPPRPRPHPSLHAARSASPSVRSRRCAAASRRASRSASRSPSRERSARDIAESRMEIEQARLLTLKAAHMMDTVGNKAARGEIAMIKVVVPRMALRVLDRAIQAHGAAGVSRRLSARRRLGAHTHAPARRRTGRSAPRGDRENRTQKGRR